MKTQSPVSRDISALITLSKETTSKLHVLSKHQGRTITHVMTALSILAHSEASLATAAENGPERFREVAGSFLASEMYNIVFTFMNYVCVSLRGRTVTDLSSQRVKFPAPYDKLDGDCPGPLSTFDGAPLRLPMNPVRRFFEIDQSLCTVSIASSDLASPFWNELVAASADCWKEYDVSIFAEAVRPSSEPIHGSSRCTASPGARKGRRVSFTISHPTCYRRQNSLCHRLGISEGSTC
jgi:hypothetical protein